MLLLHGAQVHGLLDHLVVVGHLVAVDGLRERPGAAVVLHVREQVQELVVVGPVAGLARQLVHVWGPPGGLDGGDGQGVDGPRDDAGLGPLPRRLVDDVGGGEGADLGLDGFLLLEEHAGGLQVADLGDQAALHDGAAFVVFDVAHPERLFEGDVFGEALLLEIADGVVVGVGEEVLNWGSGLDVVFQMAHEMCAVAFDLLLRVDGEEDDFSKGTRRERAVGYSSGKSPLVRLSGKMIGVSVERVTSLPNYFKGLLDDCHRKVSSVIHETSYVVLWHFRELLLEDTFKTGENDGALWGIIVIDSPKFYLASPLFYHGGLKV